MFDGLQLKVGGVRAEAVQVEVGVLVAAFGVRIAKLEKNIRISIYNSKTNHSNLKCLSFKSITNIMKTLQKDNSKS